ncbi:MAG: hypothetical protein HY551_04320 [Elusimicrobia bacterium]|nr:hypothetical protein [Elusimicrobiota bacterium]
MARSKATPAATRHAGQVLSQIRELYRFMLDQKLETLEYDHKDTHVRLVRQRSTPVPVPIPVAAGYPSAAAHGASAAPGAPPAGQTSLPPGAMTIKAPMMGIFYRASSPSSPPFVRTGDRVKKGHVLCLIEAMKVFNEVKADFDCVVLDLVIENGKPIKAGQELFVVQKS